MKKRIKVAMTGAAGQIGYALLFRVSSGQMFGPEIELELQLLELEQALGTLRGIVMELEDCAFPLLKSVRYGSDAVSYTHLDVYKRQPYVWPAIAHARDFSIPRFGRSG